MNADEVHVILHGVSIDAVVDPDPVQKQEDPAAAVDARVVVASATRPGAGKQPGDQGLQNLGDIDKTAVLYFLRSNDVQRMADLAEFKRNFLLQVQLFVVRFFGDHEFVQFLNLFPFFFITLLIFLLCKRCRGQDQQCSQKHTYD